MTDQINPKSRKADPARIAVRALPSVDIVAAALLRYGLVIVIGWIGLLKFAHYEAHQIAPLVAHSPFMGSAASISRTSSAGPAVTSRRRRARVSGASLRRSREAWFSNTRPPPMVSSGEYWRTTK